MNRIILYIIFLMLMMILPSQACDYCMLTQGFSPLETTAGKGFRIDERYTRIGTLFDNGEKIKANGALETHWTTQIMGFYSVTPKLTFSLVIPVASRKAFAGEDAHPDETAQNLASQTNNTWFRGERYSNITQHGGDEAGSSFGLSDITLLGRYHFVNKHQVNSTFIAAAQFGIRLPTGKTDVTDAEGAFIDSHIQPGTGAVNYLVGLSLSYAYKRLHTDLTSLFGFPTKGEVGETLYEYGNAVNYELSLKYRLKRSMFAKVNYFAAIGLAGEKRGSELLDGVTLEGTGGHTVYATPGFQMFYKPLIFELAFWQPIVNDLDGRQLGETFKTIASINFLLN